MNKMNCPALSRIRREVAEPLCRRSTVAIAGLALGLLAQPVLAIDADVQKQLEMMRQQIEALQAQLQAQQQTQNKLEARQEVQAQQTVPTASRGSPEVSFGGQYRINAYSADNDVAGQDNQTASRARIRQNIDLKFTDNFKTHLQLELGHTTDNVTTTSGSDRKTNVNVRHAVLDYTFGNGINMQVGIVPLDDHFGDTLFSSDWDYNPVAVSFTAPVGSGTARAFAATLHETIGTGGETTSKDDTTHYQLDYNLPLSEGSSISLGASHVSLTPNAAAPFSSRYNINYGISGHFGLGNDMALNAFLIGSHTEKGLISAMDSGNGAAIKIELAGKAGPGNFGLMVTHATGNSRGDGFIPTMALSRANGYWGYTGILTIQGPTDTGVDGDSVNISNNGYGMTTVQAKYAFPITADLSGYISAGWFGNTDTPVGRSGDVGADFLLMGTYRFNNYLALDFGGAYARLEDSVSGYSNGIINGASFNQAAGVDRDKKLLFTRLQAEF